MGPRPPSTATDEELRKSRRLWPLHFSPRRSKLMMIALSVMMILMLITIIIMLIAITKGHWMSLDAQYQVVSQSVSRF